MSRTLQGTQLDDTVTIRAEDLAPSRVPPDCVKRGPSQVATWGRKPG
jgi:hypothetical protein